jgi:hypothetical protein
MSLFVDMPKFSTVDELIAYYVLRGSRGRLESLSKQRISNPIVILDDSQNITCSFVSMFIHTPDGRVALYFPRH